MRLEEWDREVAEQEPRVRDEEGAVARGGHRVIPDPERDTPPTNGEGQSPSEKRARGEGDNEVAGGGPPGSGPEMSQEMGERVQERLRREEW